MFGSPLAWSSYRRCAPLLKQGCKHQWGCHNSYWSVQFDRTSSACNFPIGTEFCDYLYHDVSTVSGRCKPVKEWTLSEDHRGTTLQVLFPSRCCSDTTSRYKIATNFFVLNISVYFIVLFNVWCDRCAHCSALDSSFLLRETFEVSGVLLETYLSHVTLTPVEILRL